jgi:hypothetical protein
MYFRKTVVMKGTHIHGRVVTDLGNLRNKIVSC